MLVGISSDVNVKESDTMQSGLEFNNNTVPQTPEAWLPRFFDHHLVH